MRNLLDILRSKAVLALVLLGGVFTACSSDDNNDPAPPTPGGDKNDPKVEYIGNVAHSEGVLFSEQTQLGNGDQNFVFTGKQTLKKGVYNLKGWVYVADGAELTIEPGTIIKGDKETKAALIVERGGKIWAEGSKAEPIVFT